MHSDLGAILTAAYPQVVATLIRVLGDMDRAMDATQDALVKALQVWQQQGVPENPVAWLVTVGRNRAVDQIRRDQRTVSVDGNVVHLPVAEVDLRDEQLQWLEVEDDLLRLLFTCCHPCLGDNAQITLMLKVVLGFSVEEIARALLASPASIEKRISRAKTQLRAEQIAYEVPALADIPDRLQAVLQAIYLLFNEGYSRITDTALSRGSLIEVAIRLARMTCRLFRHDPRPRSLLALMLLSAARLPARVDARGVFVPLEFQDRSLWHHGMISEGVALIDAVYAARHLPGAYQIQAAISAIHSQATSTATTDWRQIVSLYGKLMEYDASPVIPVNQAVALCFCDQAPAAADILHDRKLADKLQTYQPYYAALAMVAERLGDVEQALVHLRKAIQLADSSAQTAYLQQRLDSLQG